MAIEFTGETAFVKQKGTAYVGGQKLKLNRNFYVKKHGGKKSIVIKATKQEMKTATNIGLLLLKSNSIMDILSFLMLNKNKEMGH
jgi:hypothetical protein